MVAVMISLQGHNVRRMVYSGGLFLHVHKNIIVVS